MSQRMRGAAVVVVMVSVLAVAAVACGSGSERTATPSAPAVTATAAVTASPATASASARATSPAAIATDTPAAIAATPPASGETGIAGLATVGPTCPVERADSPCPDRPYEARITVWTGTTMVAETRSGADGRFFVLVPPGEYRVVGESGSTFPHGTETTVTVVAGQMAEVALRFDSGIR